MVTIKELVSTGRFDEAFEMAVSRQDVDHLLAQGVILRQQGKLHAARDHFQRVVSQYPSNAQACTYLAMLNLSLRNWQAGWSQFRARWITPGWERMRFPREYLWNGDCSPGLRLLLWSEQGYGDAIQFGRYIPWLIGKKINLMVQVPEKCQRLFGTAFPQVEVVGMNRPGFSRHFRAG